MATPTRAEYITLVDGEFALMCGSAAIDCYDWSGLFGTGDSRGTNRKIPGQPGASARRHVRGELFAELAFRCRGDVDTDGIVQPEASRRDNVLSRVHEVRQFLSGADGRQLAITLVAGAGVATEPVTFKSMGAVTFAAAHVAEFRVFVSVPSGMFPFPQSGALQPGSSGYTAGY